MKVKVKVKVDSNLNNNSLIIKIFLNIYRCLFFLGLLVFAVSTVILLTYSIQVSKHHVVSTLAFLLPLSGLELVLGSILDRIYPVMTSLNSSNFSEGLIEKLVDLSQHLCTLLWSEDPR